MKKIILIALLGASPTLFAQCFKNYESDELIFVYKNDDKHYIINRDLKIDEIKKDAKGYKTDYLKKDSEFKIIFEFASVDRIEINGLYFNPVHHLNSSYETCEYLLEEIYKKFNK